MAKLLVLVALCILPAIASAAIPEPFTVTGKVYCDTCRVGYETPATTYLPGCIVKLVCKKRDNPDQITFTKEATTDSTGKYEMQVAYDAGDDICEMEHVKSSDPTCATPNAGRDHARICLTRNNGMVSNVRHANNIGYFRDVPLARCPQILQRYQDAESD
ncbi:unnamed protein product [Coffea canephora]|uniref:Major pollen allergen Lol p 11-like n=2 Tax=Coffea TaxID=13442 RepID=A0A068TZQ3_COFCA|nr:major pollen allergen Lol p 11-like [Coffea arabica]XP_027178741.1 major pollen allergen Lol p 11-like [Coffea eugenioides]CDP01424.1 unnamed protein product [Coffea canephora]